MQIETEGRFIRVRSPQLEIEADGWVRMERTMAAHLASVAQQATPEQPLDEVRGAAEEDG